jgi:hypothetical protein
MPSLSAIVSTFSLVIASSSVVIAVLSLQTARGLNRAKFLYDLHQDFFVAETYKTALDILDEPSGDMRIADLLKTENPDLTTLLNAFELVAYFVKTKQLQYQDADALLGYYLDCFTRHTELRKYISDESKSFENLKLLLAEREELHAP